MASRNFQLGTKRTALLFGCFCLLLTSTGGWKAAAMGPQVEPAALTPKPAPEYDPSLPLCPIPPTVRLQGHTRLVIGDSMVRHWPEADVISSLGATMPQLVERVHGQLPLRLYDEVIIWGGTAHFYREQSEAEYLTHMRELLWLAGLISQDVTVILPAWINEELRDAFSRELSARARIQIINPQEWLDHNPEQLDTDAFHLSTSGTGAFAAALVHARG